MHQRKRKLCGLILVGILAAICQAQQERAGQTNVAKLLAQLRAEQWTERAEAYEKLRSDPKALSTQEVQKGLLGLLDKENQLIESVNRDSGGPSVDEKYGEEYPEYVAQLGETVDSFADWTDPRQVCIFVHEPYNPDSRFADKIASHGKVAIPCLLRMYSSDVGLARAEAAPLIVQALAKNTDGSLDQETTLAAKQVLLKALHDPSEAVRINTIEALRSFGQEDMVPALRQVAQSDPAPGADGDSIRKWAGDAIVAIEKRSER